MQIKIEPVKHSEVHILADISSKCFYDTFHQQNTKEDMELCIKENFNPVTLKQEMLQAENYFFFAKSDDKIVGYIKLSAIQPSWMQGVSAALEIARIYVIKDKIGAGIGKRLIEFAFSFAKKYNRNTIWLGVWEKNFRAINFYRSYGFEKFSEHVFMVGNDAQTDWLMQKNLVL